MMSTAENISATRTAKQQTRAKTTMHFCCDWKREGERAISGCKHEDMQVRAGGHKATQALRLFKTPPCVLQGKVVNTWLLERGRSLGENTRGFYVHPTTQSSTSSRLCYGMLNYPQWYPGFRTSLSFFTTQIQARNDVQTMALATRPRSTDASMVGYAMDVTFLLHSLPRTMSSHLIFNEKLKP